MSFNGPRISIITPSFNQAAYLERTILSVLDQGYPDLEYIVIDGGSTDGSVEILRKYADRLSYWVSEPDQGQAHAINKGLRRATGDWIAWQNSDDIYYPDVFHRLARKAQSSPKADLIIGNMNLIDSHDHVLRDIKYVRPTYRALLAEGMVLANQAAFWRRRVHDEIGCLDESFDCAFDYEWFLRLLRGRHSVHIDTVFGGLRSHEETKTHNRQGTFDNEFQRILQGREMVPTMRKIYQFRRFFLMLLQGHFRYLLRGSLRRMGISSGSPFMPDRS